MRQNKYYHKTEERGSIFKWVLLLIAFLLVLSYFGFDLKSFIESDSVQNNFSFLWDFIGDFWKNYLQDYVAFAWEYVKPLFSTLFASASGTENILELIKNIEIPVPGSIIPEVAPETILPENSEA